MTDIVKRLRAHPGEGMTVTEQFRNMVEQRHEAADEIARLRALIPPHIVREFMAHRHFWAAHEIDIVARKDAKEYRLEGDWLKDACRALEAKP